MDSDKCCDYCPTSHTWACLSRHTADERADALRHQAAHDTTRRRAVVLECAGGTTARAVCVGDGDERVRF